MAHRHKMQRGGAARRGFAGGGDVYAGGNSPTKDEAGSKTETFKRGGHKAGGAVVGKAFGGGVKGRADKRKRGGGVQGFAGGGKVWSHAAGGIKGTKAMAAEVMRSGKLHDETHDGSVKTANDGASDRSGHGSKAGHQYKAGGRVAKRRGGKCEEDGEGGDDEEEPGYAFGGVTTFKKGGGLKMHYVGGRGRKGRADGGAAEPDADDEVKPRMARGGGCWMEKAFAGSHGQFKAKAKKAGMSTGKYASKEADSPSASAKTKRQANLAKIGAEYGGG